MRVGFICDLSEQDFAFAAQQGMKVVEYNVNEDDISGFLSQSHTLQKHMYRYGVEFSAIGRFGRNRISDDPEIRNNEQADAKRLIDFCHLMGVRTFVCGTGPLGDLSLEEGCKRAVEVIGELAEYARGRGVRLAIYSCRWGNFVNDPASWSLVLPQLPDVGIKYDPSHCIYEGSGEYLKETRDFGSRFMHVHIKGSLRIDGKHFEDPPAGMDETNWGAFIATLYHHNYQGDLIIEPHSGTWGGARYYPGIMLAKRHIDQFLY